MTTTTTPAALPPRPLMGAYLALVLDALDAYEGLMPLALPRELDSGALRLAWSGPGLPPPRYCQIGGTIDTDTPAGFNTSVLIHALQLQHERYAAQGLDISAADCLWLAAKLRAGALQLTTADTLQAIRNRSHARGEA